MKRAWRNYSLAVVLCALWLFSWALQTWFGWRDYVSEMQEQGTVETLELQRAGDSVMGTVRYQDATWDGYLDRWAEATFENWQSEFLQLLTFVVLTTYLVYRGSHESRDGQDRMEDKIDALQRDVLDLRGIIDAERAIRRQ